MSRNNPTPWERKRGFGKSHIVVDGIIDQGKGGKVTLDRERQIATVKLERGRSYTLPLLTVAKLIVARASKLEAEDAGVRVPRPAKRRR